MAENRPKETLVEDGTEFEGTLTSQCPVVVRGSLSGKVRSPQLTITESGAVKGEIKAERIQSAGVLAGSVDAGDIKLAGEVQNETVIRARTLEVQLSATEGRLEVTFGKCTLEVGDEPTAEEPIPTPEPDTDDDESDMADEDDSDGDDAGDGSIQTPLVPDAE